MDIQPFRNCDLPLLSPFNPTLRTAPASELFQKLTQWLWTGKVGAIVTGPARIGKTTALESLARQLRDRRQRRVPVFVTSMDRLDKPSVKSLNWQLCSDAGIKTSQRQTSYQLATSFAHWLMDAADLGGVAQIVLLVDECQRLTPDQFDAFADLYNKVRMKQRLLLTVFVGNDQETGRLADTMSSSAYAHIHGRFFREHLIFRGLRSLNEVRDCLDQYDTLPHPFITDCTIVEGVLPETKDSGFRLSSAAPLFWCVFRDYQKRYKLTDWGMESFTIATNTLLADFLPRYGIENLSKEMVEEAIRISGLLSSKVTLTAQNGFKE